MQPAGIRNLVPTAYLHPMKSLSAAVVVAAGSAMLSAGAFCRPDDSRTFLQVTGAVVGLIGMLVWLRSLDEPGE